MATSASVGERKTYLLVPQTSVVQKPEEITLYVGVIRSSNLFFLFYGFYLAFWVLFMALTYEGTAYATSLQALANFYTYHDFFLCFPLLFWCSYTTYEQIRAGEGSAPSKNSFVRNVALIQVVWGWLVGVWILQLVLSAVSCSAIDTCGECVGALEPCWPFIARQTRMSWIMHLVFRIVNSIFLVALRQVYRNVMALGAAFLSIYDLARQQLEQTNNNATNSNKKRSAVKLTSKSYHK